jgi:ribonuclease BN (tRNA processing enzyme)
MTVALAGRRYSRLTQKGMTRQLSSSHKVSKPMSTSRLPLILTVLLFAASTTIAAQSSRTQIVMLGTGTPIPDPDRSGPAVAIVVDTVAYLFDAGAGVVRRAAAAGRNGVRAFAGNTPGAQPSPHFDRVFLTHLHSDHTLGLADVILTPWVMRSKNALDIYGPPGTRRLVNSILDGYAEDIAERTATSGGPSTGGWKAVVHEIGDGIVYKDSRVTVRAFAVPHSGWKYAFGYRVDTPDRTIVLSGDTRGTPAVAQQCNGCDVMIHEVYSDAGFRTLPALRQIYHKQSHTSATHVGDIATQGRPRLLILNHQLFFGSSEEMLVSEVRSHFNGKVVSAHDLQVF